LASLKQDKEKNPMRNKERTIAWMLVLLALSTLLMLGPGVALAKQKKAAEADSGSGVRSQIIESTAIVQAVDQKQRLVTLKDESSGEIATLQVDDSVKNLKQVKKGDRVTIQYYAALVWNLIKNKNRVEPSQSASQTVTSAKPGEKPAGEAKRTVHLIAEIEKIDSKAPSVTLKGPDGNSETFVVQHPEKLKGVKVGDQVDITYTEALAVSVEEAPKK
jgi:Cu/Ag efflux protein CusF